VKISNRRIKLIVYTTHSADWKTASWRYWRWCCQTASCICRTFWRQRDKLIIPVKWLITATAY